jgi:hypothetical protein
MPHPQSTEPGNSALFFFVVVLLCFEIVPDNGILGMLEGSFEAWIISKGFFF